MLGIILKILCILGWIVLFLLALLILAVLLVLFFPVSYRISWQKDTASMTAGVRLKWLFGTITGSFDFPQPGALIVKLLGITVFDSGKSGAGKEKGADEVDGSSPSGSISGKTSKDASADTAAANGENNTDSTDSGKAGTVDTGSDAGRADTTDADSSPDAEEASGISRIKGLLQKLLQTIRQLFDKLKNAKDRADSFLTILKAEDTRLLFSHVMSRTGRILKGIRPRKVKGQITFGTGSPDTTGYGMALYGMLSPFLGQNLSVTPDFEEAVLEGQLFAKGSIFIITLLYNGLRILLDRRLRQFIRKIKREVK